MVSEITQICKHMFNMGGDSSQYTIWSQICKKYINIIYIPDQKEISSFTFYPVQRIGKGKRLLEREMIWNANVVQNDRDVQENLEWIRLSNLGSCKMKTKSACSLASLPKWEDSIQMRFSLKWM